MGILEPISGDVSVAGLTIHYREVGEGPVVLLIHGWPTSSFLWRKVMPHIGAQCRTIAIDLPGFGGSDKPVDRVYDLPSYIPVLEGFCDALQVGPSLSLAVHDAGGPIGLYWAMNSTRRLDRLAILNTLIYPEISLIERSFLAACRVPGLSSFLATPWSLRQTLRFGVKHPGRLEKEALEAISAPFSDPDSRKALVKTLVDFDPAALASIAEWLKSVDIPVQILRGAEDRILPKMGDTAKRLMADLPQLKEHVFEDCGHFLQEERPDDIGQLLAEFFWASNPG